MPALLALMERHPQTDFGAPGPLVAALECQPGYADQLAASLERQPTELGAWMANRLLNSKLPREARGTWLRRLTAVSSHPKARRRRARFGDPLPRFPGEPARLLGLTVA